MAHEFRVPPIGYLRRTLSLSMWLVILLGVQIVGILGVAILLTVTQGLEQALFCWFAPAFLGFGLVANLAFFAWRARYYITFAGVQGERVRIEALKANSRLEFELPRQEIFARLERANGRGRARYYVSVADSRGNVLLEQHMVGDWTQDRLVELLNFIRSGRGESIYEDEVRLLQRGW